MVVKKKLLKTFALVISLTLALSLSLSIVTAKQANAASNNTYYYNQLLPTNPANGIYQQDIYNKLNGITQNATTVVSPKGGVLSQKVSISVIYTTKEALQGSTNLSLSPLDNANLSALLTNVDIAASAFLNDHPEKFWFDFTAGVEGDISASLQNISNVAAPLNIPVTIDIYLPVIQSNLSIQPNISLPSLTGTTYDKVKQIHDYLTTVRAYPTGAPTPDNPKYPTGSNDQANYHTMIGVTPTSGSQRLAVCEGYAKAFKYLCDNAGIPCILVSGITPALEKHMWNYVQMDDGQWYALDVTWDDQTPTLYDFFLVGSNTMDMNFGTPQQIFNTTHKALPITLEDESGNSVQMPFTYPSLSSVKYIVLTQTQQTQPTTSPVNIGTQVTFTVQTPGSKATENVATPYKTGAYMYQWKVNKNDGNGFVNVTDGTGFNTNSYTTVPTTAAMNNYQYQCVVTFNNDATQKVTTTAATLTVNVPKNIALSPTNNSVFIGTVATPLSGVTFVASNGTVPYTYTATGLPSGISVNPTTGVLTGTPTAANVGSFPFTVRASDNAGNIPITNYYTLTINPLPPLTMTPVNGALPQGTVGTSYSQTVTATNGTAPYTFSLQSGALPAGLTLNPSTGTISGTPAVSAGGNTFSFQVKATDSKGATGTATYTLTISALPPLVMNPLNGALTQGTVGTSYTNTISATNGTAPYNFTIISGALPTGLTLSSSGTISGTPAASASGNTFSFQVKATDSKGATGTANYTLTISALPPLVMTPATGTFTGSVGDAIAPQQFTASAGNGTYTYTATGLPSGVSISTTGLLSGTPTVSGSFTFTVTATDSRGAIGTATCTLTITPALTLSPANNSALAQGTVGLPYSQPLTAAGGTSSYTLALAKGTSLPVGLSLNPATGLISGTPTVQGNTSFSVSVTDSKGKVVTNTYTINVAPVTLSIPAGPLTSGTIGSPYTATFTGQGGSGLGYTYLLNPGTLPSGFSLDSTGKLTGTSTVAGNYTFSITVTDSAGNTNTLSYTLAISNPSSPVPVVTIPTAPVITVTDPFVRIGGTDTTTTTTTTSTPPPTTIVKTIKNAIIYADDKTIKLGDSFDYMKGVTAKDNKGKGADLTKKVTVSGQINTSKAGTYHMTYSVKGANGKTVTKTVTITVK